MYPFYLRIDLYLKRTYMVLMDAKGEESLPNSAMYGAAANVFMNFGDIEVLW